MGLPPLLLLLLPCMGLSLLVVLLHGRQTRCRACEGAACSAAGGCHSGAHCSRAHARRSRACGAWWPDLLCMLRLLPWHAGDLSGRPRRARKPSQKALAAAMEGGQVRRRACMARVRSGATAARPG
jgi:hypothetical protein